MKYRKKPVVIEAVQLTQEMVEARILNGVPLPDGVELGRASFHPKDRKVHSFTCHIKTLEGVMQAQVGDWIITGVKGEKYPCKPDIFEATYDAVPPSTP